MRRRATEAFRAASGFRDDDSLLGLANPDLPRLQTEVPSSDREVNLDAEILAHLADRREPAGAQSVMAL